MVSVITTVNVLRNKSFVSASAHCRAQRNVHPQTVVKFYCVDDTYRSYGLYVVYIRMTRRLFMHKIVHIFVFQTSLNIFLLNI